MIGTTAEYSEFESAKKAKVPIPIENRSTHFNYPPIVLNQTHSGALTSTSFFLLSRHQINIWPEDTGIGAIHVLDASGDKERGGLVRPPKDVKTADNQSNGERAENAKEETNKPCGVFSIWKVGCSPAFGLTVT